MIQIKNLTKAFNEFVAVENVSFEVKKGETFALLGPNGSGKTTTLKCMVGLAVPTSGRILVNGLDVWENARQARRLISFLPQRVAFQDSLTAREIMEFYCRLRRISLRRIDQLLHESEFDFDGFADKRIGEFSGGMVQRLGLAVACLPDSPVMILDEPTVSLDPNGAICFRNFLASLKRAGKTIVLSSHMLADVEQLADRVAILVGGKLVALESVEALREGLMKSCKMRVIIQEPHGTYLEAACRAGAEEVISVENALLITSRAENRFAILQAIEATGTKVERFATQELSLEDIYLRYIHEQDNK